MKVWRNLHTFIALYQYLKKSSYLPFLHSVITVLMHSPDNNFAVPCHIGYVECTILVHYCTVGGPFTLCILSSHTEPLACYCDSVWVTLLHHQVAEHILVDAMRSTYTNTMRIKRTMQWNEDIWSHYDITESEFINPQHTVRSRCKFTLVH